MSSNSLDGEFKKPKIPRTSISNRDKPLFTSRRTPPRLQQRTDFFTDSLNTSYIPTPSPTKVTTRPRVGAKPRQANVNGKPLSAAFKSTRGSKDGDRPSSSTSSPRPERQKDQQVTRKPRAQQVSTRGYSSPVGVRRPAPRSATRTPSPQKDRKIEPLVSPASEASASSPPRGLAEAYQRIQDEELLAGREDESIDESDFADEQLDAETGDVKLDQPHEMLENASPKSQESARRSPIEEPVGKAGTDVAHDYGNGDYTQSSGSTSSPSLQAAQREDTFDRILSQHDKDEQRLRGVLQNDLQPFKKSRVREKGGLTVDNLRRQDASSRSESSILGSPSLSSKGSDPSLNIPKGWGRKGRGNNTWLSRISQGSGKFTGDVSDSRQLQSPQALEGKASSSPVVDWLAAATEVPLPAVEGESSQTRSTSRGSTPASHIRSSQLHRQSSNDRLRRWEFLDDDFTARSLQVSDSPPIRVRSAALDAIRDREIQTLEKSAVTTNRLDELREKRSLEQVRRRSQSISTEKWSDARNESDVLEKVRSNSPRKSPHRLSAQEEEPNLLLEEPLFEDEHGDPISNSPVVVTRISPNITGALPGSGKYGESRPSSLERLDSRDVLRKLARATSASPVQISLSSEGRKHAAANPSVFNGYGEKARVLDLPPVAEPARKDGGDRDESQAKPAVEEEKPSSSRQSIERTPQQTKPNFYLKTPLVTGAWIETPLPAGRRGVPMPTPDDIEDEKQLALGMDANITELEAEDILKEPSATARSRRPQQTSLAETAPLLPKSALAAIIEKAKYNKKKADVEETENEDTLLLDDSTIQSLEELLANDIDPPAPLTPPHSISPLSSYGSHSKRPDLPTATGNPQEQEAQSYDHLTSRLSRLGLSLRDAKKGLASLEQAVSAAPARPSSAMVPASGECIEAGEFHDFIWPCERCGCRGGGDYDPVNWQTIHIPMPRLWTWQREDWRPRLTWLGVATVGGGALTIGEWIAHDIYSPPFYAYSMEGYGVDYNAPRPPFILAKLLWRSPLGFPLQLLWFGISVLVRLFASVFGFSAGFFGFGDDGVVEANGPWVYREVKAPPLGSRGDVGLGWDDGGSMAKDEYL